MPGIIEFPKIVPQAALEFGAIFANEPEQGYFAEYLTGLLVAARKNVSSIPCGVRSDHRSVLPQSLADRSRLGCRGTQPATARLAVTKCVDALRAAGRDPD
jgi:hypothetical protein